jgi:hypothetical protein
MSGFRVDQGAGAASATVLRSTGVRAIWEAEPR